MAQAQLDKFISFVSTDPLAWQEASKETSDPEQLLRNVVQYAKGKGYDFTEEEVKAWAIEYGQRPADGALSDCELEAVAGGAVLEAVREDNAGKLESIAWAGVADSLQLKAAMERKSQLLQMISNVTKAAASTSDSLVSNLK